MKPTQDTPPTTPLYTVHGFTAAQQEYLAGFMASIAGWVSRPGPDLPSTQTPLCASPCQDIKADHPIDRDKQPILEPSDLTKQELWKRAENPLDSWDRLLQHAEANIFPNEENTFRFRYFGLFYVAPAQDSFMLRCRICAGELSAGQLKGLAQIADDFGDGKAAITTRSNIQIRGLAPKQLLQILMRLQDLGLTSKGSGVDNVRNITASPTAGFDPQELIDTRPYAHALHHYILNHRDLYGLPRKFNVAFEGGGTVDTVADTNDLGFMAVRLASQQMGKSLRNDANLPVDPGVYFRVVLGGITGHKQLAGDAGIVVKPSETVAVAAAMIRTYARHGDRTDRKKARLKYLIERWGIRRFLHETQNQLAFPLIEFPLQQCERRSPPLKHGHIGVYRQKQRGKNYLGVAIPVGVMTSRQMRRLAEIALHYGSGQLRLTPWQNLVLPDITDGFVETVKRQLARIGFHCEPSAVTGGLVACTGNTGCKWAATDTKGQAVLLADYLQARVSLDRPINIHLTGCPHSCAQHYVGDIGLQGVKTQLNSASVEAYHIVFGGGTGADRGIGQQVFTAIPFSEIPALLERVLKIYMSRRRPGEAFVEFTRRHSVRQLQEMFS